MNDRVDDYRRNAEECRQQAKKAHREEDKVAWLKMAGDWLRLAENFDPTAKQPEKPIAEGAEPV
jgi:hypothetical protein